MMRAAALTLPLEVDDRDNVECVLVHVEKLGWDCCVWSDDNLSSKKIFEKWQFLPWSKVWLPRIKTSEEARRITVGRMHNLHEKMPGYLRKKPDATQVGALAERAAAVWNLAIELAATAPISQDAIENGVAGPMEERVRTP